VKHYLIYFEDQGIKPEVFTDERAAKERYHDLLPNWNVILFMECSGPKLRTANARYAAAVAFAGGNKE
jgi:hypothetical protein